MNNNNSNTLHEPLFHIVKQEGLAWWKTLLIRCASLLLGLFICGLLCSLLSGASIFKVFSALFQGAFGTSRKIWNLLRDTALLLGVALALVPAFKMKFWNLGGNGQILIGCLATTACMFYLGGKLPDFVVVILMCVSAVVAGAIWAVIPAIFKAFFNTNESLFTLMMNYVAAGLVAYFIKIWVGKKGSGVLSPINYAHLPDIGNNYLLTILIVAVITVFMFIYLKFSKHGYEITVVGESQNTARYIGINVKKVVIRTMILSGAICGIIGLLLSGSINHTVSVNMANNMGFTAIMSAWLAKFNPLVMILTSFFIVFLSRGMTQVQMTCKFTNNAIADIVIGIIYFLVIACEFFISYKLIFRKSENHPISGFFAKIKNFFKSLFKLKNNNQSTDNITSADTESSDKNDKEDK